MKWLVIAALLFAGCKKKTEEAPAPATTGSAMATGSGSAMAPEPTGSATAAAGSGSAVDVPTEQDFEDKAASDITDKNVGDKLKTLEADLAPQ